MKNNNLNIAKGLFMLMLAICLLFSSAGVHYSISSSKNISSKKESKDSKTKEEKKVSETHGFEAVIASILNPDFVKYIYCFSFDFNFTEEIKSTVSKRFFIAEKYLSTLFTHIISPNAP